MVSGCLLVFLVKNKTSFKSYWQDQTRKPRTCCAKFSRKYMNVHHVHEFIYERDKENCFRMKIIAFQQKSTEC